MANNDINIGVNIDSKGMGQLEKQTNSAVNATDNLNKSKNKYNKQEKGAAGITSNSTKAFSKMQQGMEGGLVPAYAVLAANIFAVTAAFGVLQRAQGVEQLQKGLVFTGRAAGENLPLIVEGLKEITGAALSTEAAMRAVAVGTSAGFDQGQLEGLTSVARGASLALGRDMGDAMDRLVRGAAKLEPEILDELGIMVRLDDVASEYATTLGKTANELTQFEKRMAFTNAIIDQGTVKFGALSQSIDANPYDKLAATFNNLTKEGLNLLNSFLGPIAGFLGDSMIALTGAMAGFSAKLVTAMIPGLTESGNAMAAASSQAAEYAKANIAAVDSFDGAPKDFKKLSKSIQNGTATTKEMSKAQNSLNRSISMHEKQMPSYIKRHGESSKAVADKQAKLDGARNALNLITTAEQQDTVAKTLNTRATALNAAAQGDLKTMLASLRVAWAAETAATATSTASKGFLTTSLAFLRTGFSLAAISVKAFGIALLQAIPVIGQIILFATLAYEGIKWMFSDDSKPTALEGELEKLQKRLEEFPNVITQMSDAYMVATSRTEKFVAAFKPLVGISGQVDSQLRSLVQVQVAENFGKRIQKTKELKQAQDSLARAQEKLKEVSKPTGSGTDLGTTLFKLLRQGDLEERVESLQKRVKELNSTTGVDTPKSIDAARDVLVSYKASLIVGSQALEKGTSEHAAYTKAIANSDEVMALLNKGSLSEAIALQQKNTLALKESLNAINSVKDATAKIDGFFKAQARATGVFGDRIEMLSAASDLIKNEVTPEIIKMYESLAQFEGISMPKLEAGQILSPEQVAAFKAQVASVLAQMKAIEKRRKELLIAEQGFKVDDINTQRRFGEGSNEATFGAFDNKTIMYKEQMELESKSLSLMKEGTDEYNKQLLVVLKLVSAQKALEQERANAGINATGTMDNRLDALNQSGVMETGTSLEKIQGLGNALTPLMEDLKALGPEGEVISAISQGAFAMAESFTTAFEKMDGGTMQLTDGLQMAASVVSALGSIQSAQGKAAVAAIDKQIEAEKKRDGKSRESMAKIQAMEKKKEQVERKNFEREKKTKMASAVISTALGMTRAFELGPILGPIMAGVIAAMGAQQIAMISSQSFDGGGAGTVSAPSKVSVGSRNNTTDLARSSSPSGELAYARGASGVGNMTNYTSAFTGYRAAGGNTAFMVGEQGPEMFVPDRPGTIVPADETASAQQNPVNVNFSINTIDASGVEDLLMAQQGNIIGMIRTAANAHGESFLETVDDRALTMEK